jgi:ribonuclease P protein component
VGPGDAFAAPEEGPQAADGPGGLEARGQLTRPERLGRDRRLGGADEYRRVLGSGRRQRLRYLDIAWVEKEAGHPRLGLVVPRFQFTAVARNRLRRRLKEAWRRRVAPGLPPVDVIVRARREAYAAPFPELARSLTGWAGRWGGAG